MHVESGDIFTLSCLPRNFQTEVIVDVKARGAVTLARPSRPYELLIVSEQNLSLKFSSGSSAKSNLFQIESIGEANRCRVRCFAQSNREPPIYLGFRQSSHWCAGPLDHLDHSEFTLERTRTDSSSFDLCLLPWQRERFVAEGYLHVPHALPPDMIDAALHVINRELGTVGSLVAGGVQEGKGKLVGLDAHPTLCSVITKGAKGLVESFLGKDNLNLSRISAHIALRFPQELTEVPSLRWHTDGLRQGRRHGFSLLVGVVLSDVLGEDCGNLLLWPGSHVPIHLATADDTGRIDSDALLALMRSQHHFDNSRQSTTLPSVHINEPDLPYLGVPLSVCARRGDVIVLHPDLAHCGGSNHSSSIRYMLYFRLRCNTICLGNEVVSDWDSISRAHAEDMWVDLVGVRETALSMQDYLNRKWCKGGS